VPRKLRDLAATLAVLVVLFGTLMVFSPQVRNRAVAMTGDVQSQGWSSSASPVGHMAAAVVAVTSDYAAQNPILFSFLVAAAVLFVLMVRML
jgi:RecA/RadA recombinase